MSRFYTASTAYKPIIQQGRRKGFRNTDVKKKNNKKIKKKVCHSD